MAYSFLVYPDLPTLAAAAADLIISEAKSAIAQRNRFSIALSGGSTPRTLYALLATPARVKQIEWAKTHVFWGDERCVPPDHPDSDYLLAYQSLLHRLTGQDKPAIHRLEGEIEPGIAASRYEVDLRTFFGDQPSHSFDILLLGMGEDGHTASLFPGTAPVNETEHWVASHYVSKLNSWRLTLTPPILNRSRTIIFLAAGKSKAATLNEVLVGDYNPDLLPAQAIRPVNGRTIWFVDEDAAGKMRRES